MQILQKPKKSEIKIQIRDTEPVIKNKLPTTNIPGPDGLPLSTNKHLRN